VKGNQPNLLKTLQRLSQTTTPQAVSEDEDRSHGRQVHRRFALYEAVGDWTQEWFGVKRWLRVERWGFREGHSFSQTHYYMSDLESDIETFRVGIQGHWSIENCLHWPKDVILNEDQAPQHNRNSAANYSTIRNFLITAARRIGLKSIANAKRFFANRLEEVLLSLQ
jgi:hypothetical protein